MTDVHFDWITTNEQRGDLSDFASTFDHDIHEFRFPIAAMKDGPQGNWFGYFQVVNVPILFCAFHTDQKVCSPRNTVSAIKTLSHWARMQHGMGLATVPNDTKSFTPEVMNKLGAKDLNVKLYQTR